MCVCALGKNLYYMIAKHSLASCSITFCSLYTQRGELDSKLLNMIIASRASRWPVMVQGQKKEWL